MTFILVFTLLLLVVNSKTQVSFAAEVLGDATAYERESVISASISNAYLEVLASSTGGFVMGTTGGNPVSGLDDDQPLLDGFDSDPVDIGSSFTTLRIDGVDKVLGCNEGWQEYNCATLVSPPTTGENQISTAWSDSGVGVEERITFVNNPATGREDMVKIEYNLQNNSTESLEVGLRVLLDTDVVVGPGNDAPIFIPGAGKIIKEREWLGEAVPEYWHVYEPSTIQPGSLLGQGQLRGENVSTPDRFVVADIRFSLGSLWDYSIDFHYDPISNNTVLLYFNPTSLASGQTRTITVLYGLGEFEYTYLPLILR